MVDARHILDANILNLGKKTAIIVQDQSFTYKELFDEVSRLACGLSQHLKVGELLAIWLGNSYELICLYLACLKTGIVPMPLHEGMTWTEVAQILEYTRVKILITSQKIGDRLPLDLSHTNLSRIYLVESAEAIKPYYNYHELTQNNGTFTEIFVPADSMGFVLHTSGSEGYSKGVMVSYRSINHILNYRLHYTKLTIASISIVASCLTQSVGLYQSLALLAAGATIVLLESYDLDQMAILINKYQATHLMMVVSAFDGLLHHPKITENSLKNIVFASVGADRVTARVQNRFFALTGKYLCVSYGMTESSWAITNIEGREDNCLSLGKPCPDIEIKLIDPQGREVLRGEVGEIYIKSPRTMLGYLYNETLTKNAFFNGWLASGDLAYQDDDGYFWFAGRKKNMIVLSSGDNVSPVEVEGVILSHPKVANCLVVTAQSGENSTVPWAFVIRLDESLSETTLEAFLREKMSAFKVPQKIIFVAELPVGLTGKLLRFDGDRP